MTDGIHVTVISAVIIIIIIIITIKLVFANTLSGAKKRKKTKT